MILLIDKMVSSSRKKNKGKERKAKKEQAERAKVRTLWLGWATGEEEYVTKTIECNHGCCLIPSANSDHPVMCFIDDFVRYWKIYSIESAAIVHLMLDTLQTHPKVWNDESSREMAVSILTTMGTNMLLATETKQNERAESWAIRIAKAINVLENHSGGSFEKTINSRRVAMKRRDLSSIDCNCSSKRDTLKFFSKRVSCSCLQGLYQEARKSMPKMGICYGCVKETERVELSVCSRCMVMQYCSRKCQVAHWPQHKVECDQFVEAHKQLTADENDETEG